MKYIVFPSEDLNTKTKENIKSLIVEQILNN